MSSEAEVVAELARKQGPLHEVVQVTHSDGTDALVLLTRGENGGAEQVDLDPYFDANRKAPRRRTGTAVVSDLASFIAHAKRFADLDSVIFADRSPSQPSLVAVLDYHPAGSAAAPRFGTHRTLYNFPLSDEWKAWKGMNGKPMNQRDFATWVEEHLADVLAPDSAGSGAKAFTELLSCGFASAQKLLELSRGLTVHVGGRVANHTNLASGESTLIFEAKNVDDKGAPLKVPGAFLLALPVFRGGALYQVPTRLRYAVEGGSITWRFQMFREDAVFDHAIDEACSAAQKETALPLFAGQPER